MARKARQSGIPQSYRDVAEDAQRQDLAKTSPAIEESRRQVLGRGEPFSIDRAMRFVYLVGSTTMTLEQIGQECGVHHSLFLRWANQHDQIGEAYMRAREMQMHLRADEILRIADDASNDWMEIETKAGRILKVYDHEHAKRSEIRIKARQWIMSRYHPKQFGERLQVEAASETLQAIAAKSDDERLGDAMRLIEQAKRRVAEAYESGDEHSAWGKGQRVSAARRLGCGSPVAWVGLGPAPGDRPPPLFSDAGARGS
jgi:hypothetical protein